MKQTTIRILMDKIKIASLNVRGLRDNKKRKELFNYLRKLDNDIICIQECHTTSQEEDLIQAQWGGKIIYNHGSNNSRGVMLLRKPNKAIQMEEVYSDQDGRILIAKVKYEGLKFNIANIYGPNTDSPEFYTDMANKISENGEETIIIGDFNVVLDPQLDSLNNRQNAPKSAKILELFLEDTDYLDIWRAKNPDSKIYSWMRKKTNLTERQGSRIDYALVSQGLANLTVKIEYSYGFKTDHSLVALEILNDQNKKGPGYWKFNNQLLYDKEFVSQTNAIIEAARERYKASTPDKIWECCKNDIIQWAKKHSKAKAKKRKENFQNLIDKISRLEAELPNKAPLQAQVDAAYKEMEAYIEQQTRSAAFRSRAKYTRDFEKNTRFFYSLEKSNFDKKTMKCLQKDDGTITTNPTEILEQQRLFYKKLYTSDETVSFKLKNTTGTKVHPEDRTDLESDVTFEEVTQAVKQLKRQKCPGNSGLSAEFFQFFWNKMGDIYFEALKYAYCTGKLYTAATRGIITLIPKRQKNLLLLKNWRALTMLNSSYKILAKVLANRMKTVYPYLISECQSGFMPGRQISSTLRVTIDITKFNKKQQGYLLSIDYEKCFDRIEYCAIKGSLRYLGFGEKFIQWVDLLLTGFHSATSNNGHFSEYLEVTRACRQGCPVAPLFFLACGETLAREITKHSGINGITINNFENIIAQFADDTQLFLDSQKSLQNVIQTLTDIEANTGLKVNYEKSSIHTIAKAPHVPCDKPLVWDPGGNVILGIDIKATTLENI